MRARSLFAVAALVVSPTWLGAAVQPADKNAPESADKIVDSTAARAQRRQAAGALVARLGSPLFEVREEATRRLQELGIDAVEPLLEAAVGDNLEVTCRAIRALAAIFDSGDDDTFDAAESALEKLAESPNRSAAQRASEVLEPQEISWEQGLPNRRSRRWKRAIARIRALGGIVHTPDLSERHVLPVANEAEPPPDYILVDSEWKGGNEGLVNIRRIAGSLPRNPNVRSGPPLYVIDGAPVSAEALIRLRQSIPTLEIQHRGAARLGVQCSAIDPICRITGIEKDSAADRAGLKVNDLVRRYDGQVLVNFDHLAQITQRHKVGDKVELEVLRDGETITLQAELTGWSSRKPDAVKK